MILLSTLKCYQFLICGISFLTWIWTIRVFPNQRWGSPSTSQTSLPPTWKNPPINFLFPPPKVNSPSPLNNNFHVKNFIFSCSHCSCNIYIFTSYSFYTEVKQILILMFIIYRTLFLAFKKVLMVKITPPQVPPHKKNFSHALKLLRKSCLWDSVGLVKKYPVSVNDGKKTKLFHLIVQVTPFCLFFLTGFQSIQGWRATTRHGVTGNRNSKKLKYTRNLSRKDLQIIGVCYF